MCLVVGTCCRGFKENSTSDVIFSSSSIKEATVTRPIFLGAGRVTRRLLGFDAKIPGCVFDDLEMLRIIFAEPIWSSSWLFQRAMSAKKQSNVPPDFINELLFANFISMQKLGDPVLRPFLQTLGLNVNYDLRIIPSIFKQVGIPVLLDWSGHFIMLGYYTFLSTFLDPAIRCQSHLTIILLCQAIDRIISSQDEIRMEADLKPQYGANRLQTESL
ncbi:hypothetical protein HAX54_048330 [Datura stramonium]|uniref:Uncharacterized protein n=1 Tax=Datura stramonium TaxID=4076 RepID=A0ABS8WM11_DATST|nr:hypothetical protein [Datura stramonium]